MMFLKEEEKKENLFKKNKFFICILLFLVFMGFFLVALYYKDGQKEKIYCQNCNVILIAFDGLQANHLNYYGYPIRTTPNLDSFLKKSYVFEKTISPSSWTVPTYMSVFTSMYPSEHKLVNKFSDYDKVKKEYVLSNISKLSPDAVTLAEIMKSNGYRTAAFTGDAGFSGMFGYNKGFEKYYDEVVFGGLDTSIPLAVKWLEKNKDEKFFLVLHGYDFHGQYAPPEGFDYRYVKQPYQGKYTGSTKEQGDLREEGLEKGYLVLSEEDVLFWRAIYDEKINRADERFGQFLEEIEKMGLKENTVIVIFSDHGTEIYEHKTFDHGHTLYGELVEVLFSVYIPNQSRGKRIPSLVSTMDIFPTVLNILKIENPVPNQTKGIDLTPSFLGNDLSRNQFSETDYRLYTHKRSIQTTDDWKLIITYPEGRKELYNLNEDPQERKNLANTEIKKLEELTYQIEMHLIDMNSTNSWQIGCLPVYNNQCK